MKFVLFNLAVVAALVYLFTAQGGDLKSAAAQGQKFVRETIAKVTPPDEPKPEPAPMPAETRAESKPEAPAAKPQPAPEPAVRPVPVEAADPAALRRRGEVLAGIPADLDVDAGTPALAPGSKLMSKAERRKELEALAEDMELFYVKTIGQ